jgi:acyl-coenzyme A synthetase/AMP-(fatty) acid ligase
MANAERKALALEIVGWCLGQLAYYKAPGYVAFVDALPLTSTQKIQRRELKDLAAEACAGPGNFGRHSRHEEADGSVRAAEL